MFLLEIVHALEKRNLNYSLVGGYAVSLHGAVRGTMDVDIVLQLSKPSFVAAEKAFKDLGLISRLPITAEEVFDFRKEYIENRNLTAWSFIDPKNPSRLLDIIITEDVKKMKSVKIKVMGKFVQVASISALIEMKTKSGRPQDIEDIKALRLIQEK